MSVDDLKTQIKSYPISQIVGHYISLTRKGRTLSALCPFHQDRNPSMSVNDDRGLFKCFACGVGGDHLAFVEKHKGLTFREALAECAKILGLDSSELDRRPKKDPRFELAGKTMDAAMKVYRKFAQDLAPKEFTDFLQLRDLSEEMAQTFALGFAPPQQIFISYLKSLPEELRNQTLNMASELGLIGQSSGGREFEYFQERIIFPIWDLQGQVVGFGSRATKESQKGKYINSRDSFFFHKKNLLYGYHLARKHIREKDRVILVEGYMDVITLHRFGINEAVAVMGTSPPAEKNIRLLKTQAKEVILALDTDNSGETAMARFLPLFLSEGILPKVLSFSPHKDADEFLRKEGSFELQKRIDTAQQLIDQLILKITLDSNQSHGTEGRIAALEKIFQLLSPLKEDVRAIERIHLAAKSLGLSSSFESLERSYFSFLKGIKSFTAKAKQNEELEKTLAPSELPECGRLEDEQKLSHRPLGPQKIPKSARVLLREVLRHPELSEHQEMGELLDFIGHDEIRRVLGLVKRLLWEVAPDALSSTLLNTLSGESTSGEIRDMIGSFAFEGPLRPLDEKARAKLMQDLNLRIREEALVEKRKSLTSSPHHTRENASDFSLDTLLTEISRLDKEINLLRKGNRPLSL